MEKTHTFINFKILGGGLRSYLIPGVPLKFPWDSPSLRETFLNDTFTH